MGRVESEIQRDIIGYLRGLDATYVLNVGGGASTAKGTPDLIVCHHGLFVSIEVKRPDSSYGVTKPQEIRMRQIRAANGIALVATSVSEVATALAALREGHHER